MCREINERRGTIPDCAECMPRIHPDNVEVYEMFPFVYNQLVFAGMGDAVGVNVLAIKAVFDMFGIEKKKQKKYLARLVEMVDLYLEKIKEKD